MTLRIEQGTSSLPSWANCILIRLRCLLTKTTRCQLIWQRLLSPSLPFCLHFKPAKLCIESMSPPTSLHAAHSRQRPTSCIAVAVAVAATAPCNLENGHLEIIAIQFGVQRTLREAFEWGERRRREGENSRSGVVGRRGALGAVTAKGIVGSRIKMELPHTQSQLRTTRKVAAVADGLRVLSLYLYLSLSLLLSQSL